MVLGLLIGALAVVGVLIFSYERTIRILQINKPASSVTTVTPYEQLIAPAEPTVDEAAFKAMFMNEDEEDVKYLLESGRITEEQIPDVLDALGVVHEVNFSGS
jgi:hypothetical protein